LTLDGKKKTDFMFWVDGSGLGLALCGLVNIPADSYSLLICYATWTSLHNWDTRKKMKKHYHTLCE